MKDKRAATFPFDFITMWIRPNTSTNEPCLFCQQKATYTLYHYVDVQQVLRQHDIDAAWRTAIARQVEGNYQAAYYQPVCLECCLHFATIQLGKRRPIQQLLTFASIARKQQRMDLSQVIICTVRSWDDEGDTWVVNAPNTTIEEVVQHIKTVEKKL
jgi:hypothetical protein